MATFSYHYQKYAGVVGGYSVSSAVPSISIDTDIDIEGTLKLVIEKYMQQDLEIELLTKVFQFVQEYKNEKA